MARSTDSRAAWIVSLILAIVTFALYAPVLGHGFIVYDDPEYVTENAAIQNGLTPASAAWAFTTGHASNWHPLTWISHIIDFSIYGLKHPGGHHLTNLLL